MAKAAKDFKWQYSIVQDGMVYYRRVIPLAIREAHNLPRFIKKATGVSAANGAEAIAAITRIDALQQREWAQLEKGNTAKSTLDKALQFLKDCQFNDLSDDEFDTNDEVIRDSFRSLGEKGQLPPEFALLAKMGDFRDLQTIPTVLSVALSDYLSRHKKPSDGLIYDSTSCINKFIKLHGDVEVKSITRNMVHDYVKDRLNSKVKTTTVRRELNQLSAIVNKAFLELEMDKKSPFMSIDIPAEGKDAKEKKPITTVKLEKLLAAIRNSKTTSHLIAKIQLNTGLRVSEIAVAKTSDVHLLDATGQPLDIPFISITPNEFRSLKNDGSERNVPLVGLSLVAMQEAVKEAGSSEYLFKQYAKKGGGTNASGAVNKALDFVDINSHDFRHFISTRMREKMIPLDVRETITGHSSKGSSELKGYGEGYKLEQMHPVLLQVSIS
jgi:integrase